jgi:transposase
MRENVSFPYGPLALLNNVENKFNIFEILFEGLGGKAKTLKDSAKLFTYNKLAESISINKIQEIYPYELFEEFGLKEISDRTLYRNLERIGNNYKFLIENYQKFIKIKNLVSNEQFIDFSSSYFEGNKSELGMLGYSRDHQPGKKQLVFGISTGMNGIPSGLTIQKGNVCDKTHFKVMLKTVSKVLDKNSLLIFDCGANTKKNKGEIIDSGFNYLTLKAKKRKTYLSYICFFNAEENEDRQEILSINERIYKCMKIKEEKEVKYIFFSEKLKEEQVKKREKKFKKLLENNDKILSKVKKGKIIREYISREGNILAKGEIQKKFEINNPFITGLEGYFILESSVDESPEKILRFYKQRDKAEKLIRDLKEGTDLRPIRHWSKKAVIGYLLIVFLTNCLIKLTHFLSNNIVVKNLKLLKKFLNNLTVTIIYRKNSLRERVFSNFSSEINGLFGEKPPNSSQN